MTFHQKRWIDSYLGGALLLFLRPATWMLGKVLRRRRSLDHIQTIAYFKYQGGGSLVLAFPSILGLRKRYPTASLVLVTSGSVRPFAEVLGVFDKIQVLDERSLLRLLWSCARAWSACLGADVLIDLEVYSRLSTIFSLLTMARNRIGFYLENVYWRKYLNTHLIFFNRTSAAYLFYAQITRLLGAEPASWDQSRQHLRARLALPEAAPPTGVRRIAVGQGCSDFGKERMLSASQWKTFIMSRLPRGTRAEVIFLGASAERDLAEQTMTLLKADRQDLACSHRCGALSLPDSLTLLASAEEFWGIDSGLTHLARLLGVPCVSFWGPTDPSTRLDPLANIHEEILYQKIPCSPCLHIAETTPCQGDNVCIRRLFEPDLKEDGLFTLWPPEYKPGAKRGS